MSVALDLPLEHFDRFFQLRVTLPKRASAGQPFVRGQTGAPAFVNAPARATAVARTIGTETPGTP